MKLLLNITKLNYETTKSFVRLTVLSIDVIKSITGGKFYETVVLAVNNAYIYLNS